MTMNEEERISERLKTARRLAGLTQEDAARALDVTLKTYARWERGETKGFLRQLSRIAEVFGVTSDQLLGTDDDAGPDRLERLEASVEEIRAEVAAIRSLLEERLPLVR
jgi:transcriptional regulator with XRE-family HTH domain